jgi:hypothetical protein
MDLIFELVFWIIAAAFNWLARPSQAPGESAKKAAGNRKKAQTDQASFSMTGELGTPAAQRPYLQGPARGEPEQDRSIQPKASPLEAKGVDVWAEHRKRQAAIEAEYKAKAPMNKTG